MASDAAVSQFATFFDRIRNSPDIPPIISFVMGSAAPASDSDPPQPHRVSRLVVSVGDDDNQRMVVIQSGSGSMESLMRQLAKEGHPPASKASIAAMPTVTVKENGGDCPICLDQFEVGGEGKQMPCNHVFHGDCVEKWLKVHGTCPVCRFTMPADEEEEPEMKNEYVNEISVRIVIDSDEDGEDDDLDDDDSDDWSQSEEEADEDGDHMQS